MGIPVLQTRNARSGMRAVGCSADTALFSGRPTGGVHELLMGDALIVATMQANNLTNVASLGTDFARVAGLVRYGPA